ncbi:Carboxyl-terminal-processing peptidase 2, chloroplastic-like protein [Drosera capensis]
MSNAMWPQHASVVVVGAPSTATPIATFPSIASSLRPVFAVLSLERTRVLSNVQLRRHVLQDCNHVKYDLVFISDARSRHNSFLQTRLRSHRIPSCQRCFSWGEKEFSSNFRRIVVSKKVIHKAPAYFVRLMVGVVLFMLVSVAACNIPAFSLSEENLLFLEAWRAIDRAYVDKTFNGQSWFRYRENALRTEPMNTREETYIAIKKMVATLGDPFTRFLEPDKFRSLRSGTESSLTGVGLSIGYPMDLDGSSSGLVVLSVAPGGPASRAGISSGDTLLGINDTSADNLTIYEAADILQGPEWSSVELTVRSGSEIKRLTLIRERIALNPVKSRFCEVMSSGKDTARVGYIKLASFSKNASGAVREAVETLRSHNVNSYILDLRDNGLDKGVIVYISDARGVRDIYETDGSSVIAASEPLAVLVNKGTASASEVLAGALKDNKRAVLFGEPTYGKGKIQSVFELSDGSGLAITVARYETPAHTDINKVGVIPDHPLPESFPKDENKLCYCLEDPAACHLGRLQFFPK